MSPDPGATLGLPPPGGPALVVYPAPPPVPLSGAFLALVMVQRERDRLEDELAELRGAVHDALDAETLDRTRGILRRAVR